MALESEDNKIVYTPIAAETVFNFPYPYFNTSDIYVVHEDVYGEVVTLDVSEYEVDATNGDVENGCTVTTISSYSSGDTIAILREVPYTQLYDLRRGAAIDPTALNKGLDRIVAQIQQQNETLNRALLFPVTDDSPSNIMPANRAGKVLGFDDDGSPITVALVDSGTIAVDTDRGLDIDGGGLIYIKLDNLTMAFDAIGRIEVKYHGIGIDQIDPDLIGFGLTLTASQIAAIEATEAATGIVRYATQTQALAGTANDKAMTPLRTKELIDQETALNPFLAYMHVIDQKAQGSIAQTLPSGSYAARQLTTFVENGIGATLLGSTVTIPSGTYRADAFAPFIMGVNTDSSGNSRIKIRDITNGVDLVYGSANREQDNGGYGGFLCPAFGTFTVATSVDIELQHYASSASQRFGGAPLNIPGEPEVYSSLRLWKIL